MTTINYYKKKEPFMESPQAAAMALVILFLTIAAIVTAKSLEEPTAFRWEEYTVEQGDTLWSIARDEAVMMNGEDLSSMSHIIADKNAIDGTTIYVGQTILIPKGKQK